MKKEKRQKMCLEIIDQFEQLLEEKDISIPCEDSAEEKERHDGGNNARIYDAEYWNRKILITQNKKEGYL